MHVKTRFISSTYATEISSILPSLLSYKTVKLVHPKFTTISAKALEYTSLSGKKFRVYLCVSNKVFSEIIQFVVKCGMWKVSHIELTIPWIMFSLSLTTNFLPNNYSPLAFLLLGPKIATTPSDSSWQTKRYKATIVRIPRFLIQKSESSIIGWISKPYDELLIT